MRDLHQLNYNSLMQRWPWECTSIINNSGQCYGIDKIRSEGLWNR